MLTPLAGHDLLPLTCTRAGTCCHGKQVWISPWELARLAVAAGLPPAAFRDRHTVDGGIRLRFAGDDRWRGQRACDLYDPGSRGCRAYAGRPLACRLFPLGLRRERGERTWVHEGAALPCLDACPEVAQSPPLRVDAYLAGQRIEAALAAQDATLELAMDLGEAAFAVGIDSGLLARDASRIAAAWTRMAGLAPTARSAALGPWRDRLLLPDTGADPDQPAEWVAAHRDTLRAAMQRELAGLREPAALAAASAVCLGMALHLAQACAGDAAALAGTWQARLAALAGG